MSKPTWHKILPWNEIVQWYAFGRRRWFSAPRPEGEYFRVRRDVDELERQLGSRSFAPNWELSFRKKGEIMNLARVVHDRYQEHDPVWWQVHVRAWPADDGVDLGCHWEPEPSEHPDAHLDGVGFNRPLGMDELAAALDDVGVDFEPVEWTRE